MEIQKYKNKGDGYEISKARTHLDDGRELQVQDAPKMTRSDSEYYNKAFPEGYGKELSKRIRKVNSSKNNKIPAISSFYNMYKPIYAGFYSIVPEEVKRSKISSDKKNYLLRYAASAWEIRAETDEETGAIKNYFVLRDDIPLFGDGDINNTTEDTADSDGIM